MSFAEAQGIWQSRKGFGIFYFYNCDIAFLVLLCLIIIIFFRMRMFCSNL